MPGSVGICRTRQATLRERVRSIFVALVVWLLFRRRLRFVVPLVFQLSVQPTARRCLLMLALSVLSDAPRKPAACR